MHFVRVAGLAALSLDRNNFSTAFLKASDLHPGTAPVLIGEGGAELGDGEQQEWAGHRGGAWGW